MTTRYLFNLINNDSFRESSVSIRISECQRCYRQDILTSRQTQKMPYIFINPVRFQLWCSLRYQFLSTFVNSAVEPLVAVVFNLYLHIKNVCDFRTY